MTRLGDQLREERERRGIILEKVSESTKIRKDYLLALERQDWDALPGNVFTQGYLRTYAQCLGLDPTFLLKAYARERRISGLDDPTVSGSDDSDGAKAILKRLARTRGVDSRRFGAGSKWIGVGLVGAAAGAVAVWFVLHLLRSTPKEGAPSGTQVRAEPRSTVPPSRPDVSDGTDAFRGYSPGEEGARRARGADASGEVAAPGVRTNEVGLAKQASANHLESPPHPEEPRSATGQLRASPNQANEPGPVTRAKASHLQISESGVGTSVVNRRLVGEGNRFEEGTVAWFWTRVLGGRRGDTVHHVWLHQGRVIAAVELKVGGSQWRTQSRRPLTKGSLGDWTVEARDAWGALLASSRFTCVPPR